MGGLFNSESSTQVTTSNYADSFNRMSSLTYAPTNTGGNLTLNITPDPPTGNAGIDGLVKVIPFLAAALIGWAIFKK